VGAEIGLLKRGSPDQPPVGMVMGNCVYHVADRSLRQTMGNVGHNAKLSLFTLGAAPSALIDNGARAGRGRPQAGLRLWPQTRGSVIRLHSRR
jgi:hypothetical protein